MVWYRGILFRCIEHQTLSTSKLVLWGLALASTSIGTILEIKHHRKGRNVFFNVVIGYGIYTAIAYIHIRPDLIKAVLIGIFLTVSAFFILLCMIRWHNVRVYKVPACKVFSPDCTASRNSLYRSLSLRKKSLTVFVHCAGRLLAVLLVSNLLRRCDHGKEDNKLRRIVRQHDL